MTVDRSPTDDQMSSSLGIKDVHWALQEIRSESKNLSNISFYHSQSNLPCSYGETESSLSIGIPSNSNNGDGDCFCQLLTALSLAAQKDDHGTPMNLAFHGVIWERRQLQCLQLLLDGNPNIKQLEFKSNTFGMQAGGLAELSESIGRNRVVKVLIFSECHIESLGIMFLASALMKNESLEELQIWEDSIGSKGAEELSRMIEANSTLKLLIVLDKVSITATPVLSAVLARNRTLEVHIWSKENNNDRSSKIVEFTPETSSLRLYKLDASGSRRVACALGWNTTVSALDMTGIQLKSRWAREFRVVLEQNSSLKQVILSRTCLRDKAVVYIAAGLFKNRSLESLQLDGNCFSGVGVEHLLCPLSRFSALQNQANVALKSVSFGGPKTKIGKDGVMAILRMLETNQTIVRLGVCNDASLKPEDFVKIFRSLERNATLRFLSLRGCNGVAGEWLFRAIMETLQVNPWIEEIDLDGTPMHDDGKTHAIYEKLGQNASPLSEKDLLDDLPLTTPKCCRVFLCGQEFAGKATLCDSISQNLRSTRVPYMDQVRALVNPVEKIFRTAEIKVRTMHDGDTKISLWNFAGQHENYAVHDLMFPGIGSPSFFLVVSSLFRKPTSREAKSPEELEDDLLYWLRFIVSNSRRAKSQSLLPHITIVLTHSDKVSQKSEHLPPLVTSIQRLRERFQEFVELYPVVFTVDARSSASVSRLTHHLRKTSKTILERVPRVYQVCNDLIRIISDWRSENNSKPVMRWNEFSALCQLKVPALRMRSRRDNMEKVEIRRCATANSLHRLGEVIYFEDLGFLILDCDWFCSDVLGQLIRLDVGKTSTAEQNGFISRNKLENILKGRVENQFPGTATNIFANLEVSDLIRMMLKLELCYEQDSGDPKTLLLIPTLLVEGRGRIQNWQLSTPQCVYVGRRLECHDSIHMSLTIGFFPRLQVHLHNKILRSENHQGATYSLEKNLISILVNGIHVRVELGGQLGCYIDVLACSTKSISESLRLLRQLIIPAIQSLCPGIALIQSVIRPDIIKHLMQPRFRKTQTIPLHQLKQSLLCVPAEGMYDYQHTWISVFDGPRLVLQSGFNYARHLLSDEDFREVLHRRYYDLRHLAMELAVPMENAEDSPPAHRNEQDMIEPSLSGIAKGVEIILQRLKLIEHEIKDLKQEIEGLRYYEHQILAELHRKIDFFVNYSIQLEERKVPYMFYFVRVENYTKRLVTRIVPGMTSLRLHMLCEFPREMHVVNDQIGCELMQIDNQAVQSLLPYISRFMKLLTFALKIGAHFVTGMGEMIPDLGREVAHLIDSSFIYGAAAMAAGGTLGVAAIGQLGERRSRNRPTTSNAQSARNVSQDMKAARQWLIDFLRDQRITTGRDIAERFGLWRVRYVDSGDIGWICLSHKEARRNEAIELPT